MTQGHTSRLEAALAGRYRIERKLGEGGMASVYLAEDIKHERKVALKILRPELAAVIGAERFLSEIKTTANLQHPHILPLFDSGEAGGYLYYVMPYIDGETLRDRLDREKQLGVEESLRIARDVADALDYAHRAGVIHRDIKPGNILLHDGRPVVADFGIALAVSAAGGGRMTETGLSLGTPHYMSPEQASADRDLSARSDVYSLGCVLYEMLAGQPPHTGPSAQSILVHILTEDPKPLTSLRHTVPAHVAAAVSKSIEKLPADRFESAREFRAALEDAGFTYEARTRTGGPQQAATPVVGHPAAARAWLRDPRSAAALAVGLIMTVLAAWGWLGQSPAATVAGPPVVARMSDFPVNVGGGDHQFAISADGSMIAARRQGDPSERLYLRRSDELEFREVPGSGGAVNPTFSPDGAWLAFEQDGFIRRVETAGGPVLPVAEGEDPQWGAPDVIVFQRDLRLYSVAPTGGEPSPLISDESLTAIRPALLPGGMAVVFEAVGAGDAFGGPSSSIMLIDLTNGEVTDLGLRGSSPTYVGTGHLVFGVPEQALMAVPFDLRSLETTGEVFTVLPDVDVSASGSLRFAVSDNGTALYALSRSGSRGASEVVEVTLDGSRTPTRLSPGAYRHPRYSPDGRHIALERTGEVWIYDRETGETERFSDGPGFYPVWSRDGQYVYYVAGAGFGSDIVRRRSDGTGGLEVAHSPDLDVYRYPTSASRQSDDFALGEYFSERGMNIAVMGVGADGVEVRSYLQAEYNELMPAISPDGRWIAYLSTEDPSRTRIFVRAFDDATGQIPIPSGVNGVAPVWAPDGSALYHGVTSGRGTPVTRVMRVPILPGATFSIGPAEILFEGTYASGDAAFAGTNWDVHPDGERFVMITATEGAQPDVTAGHDMRLVVNWFEELRAVEGR